MSAGAALAAQLLAHRASIEGVLPNSEDARPPDGDDWNALDALLQDVIQMLDDVSASADTMLTAHRMQMTTHDFGPRNRLIINARDFCDAILRPETETEEAGE